MLGDWSSLEYLKAQISLPSVRAQELHGFVRMVSFHDFVDIAQSFLKCSDGVDNPKPLNPASRPSKTIALMCELELVFNARREFYGAPSEQGFAGCYS